MSTSAAVAGAVRDEVEALLVGLAQPYDVLLGAALGGEEGDPGVLGDLGQAPDAGVEVELLVVVGHGEVDVPQMGEQACAHGGSSCGSGDGAAQQGGGVAAAHGVEVGVGQARGAQRADGVLGAHVEGEVGAEQHPVRAGRADQLPQYVGSWTSESKYSRLQVAARQVGAAAARVGRADQAWSERPMWVGR